MIKILSHSGVSWLLQFPRLSCEIWTYSPSVPDMVIK